MGPGAERSTGAYCGFRQQSPPVACGHTNRYPPLCATQLSTFRSVRQLIRKPERNLAGQSARVCFGKCLAVQLVGRVFPTQEDSYCAKDSTCRFSLHKSLEPRP